MKNYKKKIIAICAGYLVFVLQSSAVNTEIEFNTEKTTTTQVFFQGAYTDIFDADILTEESAEIWKEVSEYEEKKLHEQETALELIWQPVKESEVEQTKKAVSKLSIFDGTKEYYLKQEPIEEKQISIKLGVVIFVILGLFGFSTAQLLRKYRRKG